MHANQPNDSASFSVVGCSSCSCIWIAENKEEKTTARCPGCGKQHQADRLRALKTADDHGVAAERRTRILASRWDLVDELNEEEAEFGSWTEQRDEVESRRMEVSDSGLEVEVASADDVIDHYYGDDDRDGTLSTDLEGTFHADVKQFSTYNEARIDQWRDERKRLLADQVPDRVVDVDEEIERYYGAASSPAPRVAADDVAARPDAFADSFEPSDPIEISPPTDAGLTPTDQDPVDTAAIVSLDATPTAVWQAILDSQPVREAFVRAVRSIATDASVAELYATLEARDVPYWLRSPLRDICLGDRREAWRVVDDVLPSLATGRSSIDDVFATASLFEAIDEAPTLTVRVPSEFRERDAGQRRTLCNVVAALSRAFDVRLVTTGLTRRWLAHKHRSDLPAVSEWTATDHSASAVAAAVNAAVDTLDEDDREVEILRMLNSEATETLPYGALYASFQVTNARVRQCLSRLEEFGLVATFVPQQSGMVELLEAGREYLTVLDNETAGRERDDAAVSETPNSSPQCRVSPRSRGGGQPVPYRTVWLGRPEMAAIGACGTGSDISLVSAAVEPDPEIRDRRTRGIGFSDSRNEAVVSVFTSGPFQYVVSSAIALADPRLLAKAVPNEVINAIDEPDAILRNGRCIGGYSSEAAADPSKFRRHLVKWGEEIETMTYQLKEGDYEDRNEFRSEIMKSAKGLAGSISHLLDAAGVTEIRDVRLKSGLDKEELEAISKAIAHSMTIESQYKSRSAFRQLCEPRKRKRRSALSVDVDAADPTGSLIGGLVVRSTDVHRIRDPLEDALANPAELVEDAPEFNIQIGVREADRREFATVASRILGRKQIKPTREVVSLLTALVGDPFDAARALFQLGAEDYSREIRPGEIRAALTTLDPARLLPDLAGSVGKIVFELLAASEPMTQTELASRAGVSTQTIRDHRENLEALDLVAVDGHSIRLAVSFQEPAERKSLLMPAPIDASESFIQVVDRLLVSLLPPARYGDPEDPIGGVLFDLPGDPANPWRLLEEPDLAGWVSAAIGLTGTDRLDLEGSVSIGPTIEQQSITEIRGIT